MRQVSIIKAFRPSNGCRLVVGTHKRDSINDHIKQEYALLNVVSQSLYFIFLCFSLLITQSNIVTVLFPGFDRKEAHNN